MRRIALIDDETLHAKYYVLAIESKGYACVHFKSPASVLTAIDSGDAFDCYVTDLMMPPRGAFALEDTENGLITGALLAVKLRAHEPSAPIIIFSNINVGGVIWRVKTQLRDVQNVVFVRKANFMPEQLADAVVGLLEHSKPLEERRSLLRSLLSSLLLTPNFFGLGVDLRRLLPKSWQGHD